MKKLSAFIFVSSLLSTNAFASWDTWRCVDRAGILTAQFMTRFDSHSPISGLTLLSAGDKKWEQGLNAKLKSSSENIYIYETDSTADAYIVKVTFLEADFARMEIRTGDGLFIADKVACMDQSWHRSFLSM
jgi:hypothetical protein